MFAISYGVLLKSLPFRADRQLFDVVESTAEGDETFAASYSEITQWQQATANIADVAFASNYVNIIDAPAGAEMISPVTASPNLFTLLGVLLMTLVGLYGLLTYTVEQRTREIGIRMALGADRAAVIRMVMRQALLLMAVGAAAGVCIALWSNRLLHAFLYGVTASDPWALALMPLGLILCGLAAAAVPARRAARLDPVDALRAE
jgi:ABC-type antimicrobial peptide transport system permease subunit